MAVAACANAEWSMDFTADALYHGRRFRTLNVLDAGVREALDIVVDTSTPGGRVVRSLDRLGRIPPTMLGRQAENAGNPSFELSY